MEQGKQVTIPEPMAKRIKRIYDGLAEKGFTYKRDLNQIVIDCVEKTIIFFEHHSLIKDALAEFVKGLMQKEE